MSQAQLASVAHEVAAHGYLKALRFLEARFGLGELEYGLPIKNLLKVAALCDHFEIVEYLMTFEQVRINFHNADGYDFLLHHAIRCSKIRHIDALLCLPNQDPDTQARTNAICLDTAAQLGNADVFRHLLTYRDIAVNVHTENKSGHTPFHIAIMYNNLEVVQFLASLDTTEVDMPTRAGHHPVHLTAAVAVKRDPLKTLKYLLTLDKINVCACDKQGRTVLHHAARRGRRELTEYLLDIESIDPNARDDAFCTPMHHAAEYRHGIAPQNDALVVLMRFAQRRFASRRARVNLLARDEDGNTPLHKAALLGTTRNVELLLAHKLVRRNMNIQNNNGETVLHLAVQRRPEYFVKRFVELLISVDSLNINQRDTDGYTALEHWCKTCGRQSVNDLLQHRRMRTRRPTRVRQSRCTSICRTISSLVRSCFVCSRRDISR